MAEEMKDDYPPATRRERLALVGIALAFVAVMGVGFNYLEAFGERLPGCPTDPPNAAAMYALVYLANTPIAHWVVVPLMLISGTACAITSKIPGLRMFTAVIFGGVAGFAVLQVMQGIFGG